MSGGGKKKGASATISNYHMSIHFGLCHGPIDSLRKIIIKEKEAWTGNATAATDIGINRMDLFGGDEKEGGVRGIVRFMRGDTAQTMPDALAQKFGRTSANMPAYRGVASCFFYAGNYTGGSIEEPQFSARGFLWMQNNPYLPSPWFTATRVAKGLSSGLQVIAGVSADFPDSNPAHIIFECLTDTDWGMGLSSTSINVDSFNEMAQTLYDEQFGLSLMWTAQSSIEDFIQEILDHVLATIFVNPRTGLLQVKLIRGDYDPDDLRTFSPDNCDVKSRQRKAWGETVNELVVTWTNPASEEEETVTVQDSGNIAMQGGIVSDSRNYYGIRRAELAVTVGARDLRSASSPLLSVEIEADRSAWDLLPGDVCKFSWPDDGLEEVVMRVGAIDYGKPGAPTITASLIEDIFTDDPGVWTTPPASSWVDPSEEPTPMTYTQFYTMPLPPLVAQGAVSTDEVDDQYPRVVAGILATHTSEDVINFELSGEKLLNTGETYIGSLGTKYLSLRAELVEPLVEEARSTVVSFGDFVGNRPLPMIGDYLLIGDGTDSVCEWAVVEAFGGSPEAFTLVRGVYDTVPRAWPAGTPIWVVVVSSTTTDTNERIATEEIDYYLRPRTSKGVLALGDAPVAIATMTNRPYCPFRPANTQIDGTTFGEKIYDTETFADVPTSWANRNRLVEDVQIRAWTDANVTPEAGQTTTIRILTEWGDPLAEHSGLSGTSFDVPYESFDYERHPQVAFISVRDGFESIQYATNTVTFDLYGYGRDYGDDYGGTLGG